MSAVAPRSYVTSRPDHPEVVVRVFPTPEGTWTARINANLGRRYTLPDAQPNPVEAMRLLFINVSHRDFRIEDIRWLSTLPDRLTAAIH